MVEFVSPKELDSKPPITEEEVAPGAEGAEAKGKRVAEEVAAGELKKGKVPLHPAMIRLPLSVIGRVAETATGYRGFEFTDRELNDLAELWMQCGIEISPVAQAIVASVSILGFKAGGYFAWRRAGKPEQKPEKKEELK